VNGGNGDDQLDGGPGNDTFTGGPGSDVAVYSARTKDVRVSLDGGDNDGESTEHDLVRATVEGARTGSGDDRINIRDGVAGSASCGGGRDVVTADATDSIASDCEQVNISSICSVRGSSVKMRKGAIRLRVTCPRAGKATVTLRTAGAYKAAKKTRKKVRLGRKTVKLKAGRAKTVKVKLSKKARRLVKKNKRLHARATVSFKTSAKAKASKRAKKLTIKAPAKNKKKKGSR
jgi:hypothetical protein